MPVKVIDASAVAAILFNEPDADLVIERIGGDTLIAPALMPFEVASVCRKKLVTTRSNANGWSLHSTCSAVSI